MRLKNIYKALKEIEPIIQKIKPVQVTNSNDYTIENWSEVLITIDKLKNIDMFEDVAKELFDISPNFSEKDQTLRITNSQYSKFIPWRKEMNNKISAIIELCESIGYGENDGSFEVKLPETNDFSEFSSYVNDFNKFIQICPFIKTDDSYIKLAKTDIGSTWLEFIITSTQTIGILTALGYITQSALKIRSMHLTCEQQKEAVRGAEIKNNLAEEITEMYKTMIKVTASNEVRNLEGSLEQPLSPEERSSAEKSLEILGKLMSKGLEVYATLDTPQEVKDVFPSITQQELLSSPMQLITGTHRGDSDKN